MVAIGIVGFGSLLDGLLREDCPLSTDEQERRGLHRDPDGALRDRQSAPRPWPPSRPPDYTLATAIAQVAATVAYAFLLYGETGGGVAQRLLTVSFMTWVALLATWALREEKTQVRGPGNPNQP